jgi:hypothetical protein
MMLFTVYLRTEDQSSIAALPPLSLVYVDYTMPTHVMQVLFSSKHKKTPTPVKMWGLVGSQVLVVVIS